MMKKLLSLLLVVALIFVLAVPASAAETYNPWIDIAEVCTVNDSGSNYFAFNNSTTVTLTPGFSTVVNQIDMIWFCGYGAPKTVYLWRNNSSSARLSLNIENIGGAYYRIYGNVGNYTLSQYKFDIDCGTGSGYRSYEIKSLRIAESVGVYDLDISYNFDVGVKADVEEYDTNVWVDSVVDIQNGVTDAYVWEIWTDQWKAYDFVDFLVSTNAASIGSIVVSHNGRSLPYEVSYLYTDSGSMTQDGNGISITPLQPSCSAVIHIDVSSISRSSNVPPTVVIEGWWNTGAGAGMQVTSCVGYINGADRTGVAYWFERGKAFFNDLFGGDQSSGALDDLGSNSDSIFQSASDIQDFEQSQQAVLDNNFAAIQNAITFTNFAAALVFVQKYANMTFNGISKYAIVLTLPLFLGLFFYLCSRIPGVTRWKSPPPRSKGGGDP